MPAIATRLRAALIALLLPLLCLLVGLLCGRSNVLAHTADSGVPPALPSGGNGRSGFAADEWSRFKRYLLASDSSLLVWDHGWKRRGDLWPPAESVRRKQGELSLEPLVQLQLERELQLKAGGETSLTKPNAQVFYSPAAADLLTKTTGSPRLDSRAYWDGQLRNPAAHSPFVTGGADPPAVVKQVFHVFNLSHSCAADCLERVAVYDPQVDRAEGRQRDLWRSSIQVDLNLTHPCPNPTQAHFEVAKAIQTTDLDPHAAGTVPIRCFLFKINDGRRLIEAPQAKQSDLHAGVKVFLLLGFHMMRADRPLWSWSTIWWSPHPLDRQHGCSMPAPGDDPRLATWQFYCMDAIDTDDLATRALAHNNPYLEGPMQHGLETNCIYCHSRALYHPQRQGLETDFASGHVPQQEQRLHPLTLCPLPGEVAVPPTTQPCPPQTIPTDFLWSLAERLNDSSLGAAPQSIRHQRRF